MLADLEHVSFFKTQRVKCLSVGVHFENGLSCPDLMHEQVVFCSVCILNLCFIMHICLVS